MGGGTWTATSYVNYAATKGYLYDAATDSLSGTYTCQDLFKSKHLDSLLDPKGVMRECRDSTEHPNTVPVILALDVTGSMGSAAAEVAKKLNAVMTKLYDEVADVEFMVMGIGDLAYDSAPVQMSQFESDIRIAEQLDKIYFEAGGGGNNYESYTAAWYAGCRHTDLDCWTRARKGIIITMGDEALNPYLDKSKVNNVFGDNIQANVETKALYEEVISKFDVYHLAVNDRHTCYNWNKNLINTTWSVYLDEDHFKVVTLDNIANTIVDIVVNAAKSQGNCKASTESDSAAEGVSEFSEISW